MKRLLMLLLLSIPMFFLVACGDDDQLEEGEEIEEIEEEDEIGDGEIDDE